MACDWHSLVGLKGGGTRKEVSCLCQFDIHFAEKEELSGWQDAQLLCDPD